MSTDTPTPPQPTPPPPPAGYMLIRYEIAADGKSGTYTPSMPVAAFDSLKVWIPDLGAWMKPKFIVGNEPRWFAVKQR